MCPRQVCRAKTVNMLTKSRQEVSPGLTVSTMCPVPVKAEIGVSSDKVSASEFIAAKYGYYAFVVKTARSLWDEDTKSITMDATDRATPTKSGAKGKQRLQSEPPTASTGFIGLIILHSGLPPNF